MRISLDVLAHHGNHEVEQTDGLDEGKAQNGVGEELTTEGRVAGDTQQEGTEDETDTDTSTTETNGGRTHTQVLGDLNHSSGDFGGVVAASLLVGEDLASVGLDEVGGLLTLGSLEGSGEGSGLLLRAADFGEGALGSSVQLGADGRASGLGGHGGGQAGGEDARGHCDGGGVVGGRGETLFGGGKSLERTFQEEKAGEVE